MYGGKARRRREVVRWRTEIRRSGNLSVRKMGDCADGDVKSDYTATTSDGRSYVPLFGMSVGICGCSSGGVAVVGGWAAVVVSTMTKRG